MKLVDISQRHLLSASEQRMLEYILESVEGGDGKINIRSVANACYVSTTVVIKLAKKLGYSGYSDMIYSLRRRSQSHGAASAGIDLTSILVRVEQEELDGFAEALYRHRNQTVFVVGLGFSTMATSYFMKRLAILGIRAYDGSPIDMLKRGQEPGLLMFVSRSGETQDLIAIAECVKGLDYELLTITANAESTLARVAGSAFVVRTGDGLAYDVPDFFVGRAIILFEYVLSKLVERMRGE